MLKFKKKILKLEKDINTFLGLDYRKASLYFFIKNFFSIQKSFFIILFADQVQAFQRFLTPCTLPTYVVYIIHKKKLRSFSIIRVGPSVCPSGTDSFFSLVQACQNCLNFAWLFLQQLGTIQKAQQLYNRNQNVRTSILNMLLFNLLLFLYSLFRGKLETMKLTTNVYVM